MPESYAYFVVNGRRYDGLDAVPPSALLPLAVHLFQFPAETSETEQVLRLSYDDEILFPSTPLTPPADVLARWFSAEDVAGLTGPTEDLPRHAPLFDRLAGALILEYELPDALPDSIRNELSELLSEDTREFYAEIERAAERGARALDAFDVVEYEWTHVAVRNGAHLETNVEVLNASEDGHDTPSSTSWSWQSVAGPESATADAAAHDDAGGEADTENQGWPYTSKWPDYDEEDRAQADAEPDAAGTASGRDLEPPKEDADATAGEDIEFPDEEPEDLEQEIEAEHDYGASYDFSPDTPAPRADDPPSSARTRDEPHEVETEITGDDTVAQDIESQEEVERVVEDDARVDRELTARHSTPETYVFGPTRSLEEDIGPAIAFDFGPQRDINELGPKPRPDRASYGDPTGETYASAASEGADATVVSSGESSAATGASATGATTSRADTDAADRRTCLFQIAILAVALFAVAFAVSQLL